MNTQINRIWLTCGLVFSAITLVVLISFFVTSNTVSRQLNTRVNDYSAVTEDLITDEIRSSEDVMRIISGWLNTNPNATGTEWSDFIEKSGLIDRYTGIAAIAYSNIIQRSEIKSVEQKENIPVVSSTGDSSLSPVYFIYPNKKPYDEVIGYDMYSEDLRREAMLKARDDNRAYVTGPIPLLVDTSEGSEENLGFVLHVPRYAVDATVDSIEGRRNNIVGYVHVGYQTKDFFAASLAEQTDDMFTYQIYSNDQLLYEEPGFSEVTSNKYEETTISSNVGGAEIDIRYVYNPEDILTQSVRSQPTSVLVIGITGATLVTFLTWLLLSNRNKELLLEKERDINDAKDSLLSIASHQLRTPATGVKQYLGMVLQGMAGDITDTQRNFLEKAYESNDRQLKTINDVLYLARLEAGRIVLSKTKIKMRTILYSLIEEMHESIEENSHKLTVKAPKHAVYVWADEHMVRMILENLLSNAIKYTPEGGKIAVTLKKAKGGINVLVKDSGVGIKDEQKDEIFKQFSRVGNSLSKSVSGSGVGLYLVKNLAEMHEGSIQVESDGETGSTFILYLPTNRPEEK